MGIWDAPLRAGAKTRRGKAEEGARTVRLSCGRGECECETRKRCGFGLLPARLDVVLACFSVWHCQASSILGLLSEHAPNDSMLPGIYWVADGGPPVRPSGLVPQLLEVADAELLRALWERPC